MTGFVMQDTHPRELIDEKFSRSDKNLLNQAIVEGYKAVNTWIKDDLNRFIGPHSKEARGRIISWLIEYYAIQLVDQKAMDFQYHYEYTDVSGLPYLVLGKKDCNVELTINQVASRNRIARPSKDRTNKTGPFQSYLDLTNESENTLLITEKPKYFQLTHGYQSVLPKFVVLGIPNEDNTAWIDGGSIDISAELRALDNTRMFKSTQIEFKTPSIEEIIESLKK